MDPIPETAQALAELQELADSDLLADLQDSAARVLQIVPTCVGLSVASTTRGLAFTLVATTTEVAALDAVQYVDAGPCVDAVHAGRVVTFEAESTEESRWQLFAQATAGVGVRSSLTLPVRAADVVTGSINLYASTARAFDGHHEELAAVFGAWAPGAVTNADLAFATRQVARRAPVILEDHRLLAAATGILASRFDVPVADARGRLTGAADRAGLSPAAFARYVVRLLGSGVDDL